MTGLMFGHDRAFFSVLAVSDKHLFTFYSFELHFMSIARRLLFLPIALSLLAILPAPSRADAPKTILILCEGSSSLKNAAIGLGRQLGALLGHFNTTVTIK